LHFLSLYGLRFTTTNECEISTVGSEGNRFIFNLSDGEVKLYVKSGMTTIKQNPTPEDFFDFYQ